MLQDKLTEAITAVMNNKTSVMLENAYNYAQKNFSIELMGDQYLRLYNKICIESIIRK